MAVAKKKKKTTVGRKNKLTKKLLEEILKLIRLGVSYKDTCISLGIGETTFYRWKNIGLKALEENKDSPYNEFVLAIEKAEVDAKLWRIMVIANAERKDARLALEMLARKYPDEFGRKDSMNIKGNLKVEAEVSMSEIVKKYKQRVKNAN